MSRNQKLAPLLANRTIAAVEPPPSTTPAPAGPFAPSQASTWHVRFGDGSALAVRTDGTAPTAAEQARGRAVADVTQHGTTLTLALAADTPPAAPAAADALVFHTAEPSACVMLRDAQGKMEYAD